MDPNERKKRPCVASPCVGERFDLVHKFPMEYDRTMQWLNAVDVPSLMNVPLEKLRTSYFVCSRHFRKQDYKNVISRSLNKTAIPCINLKSLDQMDLVHEKDLEKAKYFSQIQATKLTTAQMKGTTQLANDTPKKRSFNESNNISSDEPPIKQNLVSFKMESISQVDIKKHNFDGYTEFIVPDNPSEMTLIDTEKEEADHLLEEHLEDNIALTAIDDEEISNEAMTTNFIKVSHPDYAEVMTLDNFWLRDHCRCSDCYNFDTYQRRYNLLDIPLNIKPLVTGVENGMLFVKWDDNHESRYNFEFLYQSQLSSLVNTNVATVQSLWDRGTVLKLDYARVSLADLVTNDDAVKDVVGSLVKFGFAFVENVPPNSEMTEMAVRRIFPIQKTFFGEMWSFTDKKDHADTAYTKDFLGSHTDNTYFNDAAGLQILHCTKHTGTGGETFLVDGFKILNDFKTQFPQEYERLSKINIPAEYIEDGQHHAYSAPLFKLNDITGSPEQIRFNIYDRAIFNTIPQTEIFQFYKDFREFIKIVQCESNQWRFKLNPGTALFFDNWRLLHGREKYTGTRQITGCYISRTDFMSKARVLGIIS